MEKDSLLVCVGELTTTRDILNDLNWITIKLRSTFTKQAMSNKIWVLIFLFKFTNEFKIGMAAPCTKGYDMYTRRDFITTNKLRSVLHANENFITSTKRTQKQGYITTNLLKSATSWQRKFDNFPKTDTNQGFMATNLVRIVLCDNENCPQHANKP